METLSKLTLNELYNIAQQIGLTRKFIKQYGDLSRQKTEKIAYCRAITAVIKQCAIDRQPLTWPNLRTAFEIMQDCEEILSEHLPTK